MGSWDDLDGALRELRMEYRAQVSAIAQDVLDESRTHGRIVHEQLHETIDGHEWVIYTHKAQVVALVSSNADAYAEEIGEPPPDESARAYMAMTRDVGDEMLDLGWDGGDDPPAIPCDLCDGDGGLFTPDGGHWSECQKCDGTGEQEAAGDE